MHRALRIPELVELTFFQLISCPDTRKYDDRRTLARAARTSSLWTELALARLWSELACLAPLFLLLGPMQIIKRIIDNEDHDEEDGLVYAEEFDFRRPTIHPRAWRRFDHYAKYVRTVSLYMGFDPAYSPGIYEAMAAHRPNTLGLLPNLQTLHYDDQTTMTAGLKTLIILLAPSLRTISLEFEAPTALRPALTEHIVHQSPLLERLILITEPTPAEELETWIKGFKHLKHLQANPEALTVSLWDFLAHFAPLESLRLCMVESDEPFQEVPMFPPGGFGNLRSLALQASLSAWRELLEAGNVPPLLTEIEADLRKEEVPTSAHQLAKFSEALAFAIPNLRSFRLSTEWGVKEKRAVTFANIQPLLACSALRTFVIQNPMGVNVSPDDVEAMLRSWPKLRRFEIAYKSCFTLSSTRPQLVMEQKIVGIDSPKRTLSIDILSTFAELCPDIEELSISLNDTPPAVPGPDHQHILRRLCFLNIAMSPIQDVGLTALYLSRIAHHDVPLRWGGWSFGLDFTRRDAGMWADVVESWQEVEILARTHRVRGLERRQRNEAGWRRIRTVV